MPHPLTDNRTPFVLAPIFQSDEDGRPVLSLLVKGTYTWDAHGQVALAAEQLPWNAAGTHRGEPDASSALFEPETAPIKPATDVVLIGHAHAPHLGATAVEVSFQVGPVGRTALVSGERRWEKRWLGIRLGEPQPFERIALSWENSFGGWDRSHPDAERHGCEARNPLGAGYRTKGATFSEDLRVPNLEDPLHPLRAWAKPVAPVGFGFTSPAWQPRAALAGTFDAAWESSRSPQLPADFDRRFFNAAPAGLVAAPYLRGDEAVSLRNATPGGVLDLRLPGMPPPRVVVAFRSPREDALVETVLDTVIVDADASRLVLLWRVLVALEQGPHEVSAIEASCAAEPISTA
jgi:hypothetical protein